MQEIKETIPYLETFNIRSLTISLYVVAPPKLQPAFFKTVFFSTKNLRRSTKMVQLLYWSYFNIELHLNSHSQQSHCLSTQTPPTSLQDSRLFFLCVLLLLLLLLWFLLLHGARRPARGLFPLQVSRSARYAARSFHTSPLAQLLFVHMVAYLWPTVQITFHPNFYSIRSGYPGEFTFDLWVTVRAQQEAGEWRPFRGVGIFFLSCLSPLGGT